MSLMAMNREVRHSNDAAPHVIPALLARGEGMLEAFERIGSGAILIGADGLVAGMNAAARRHLGGALSIVRGELVGCQRQATLELRALMGRLKLDGRGPTTIVLPRGDGRPLLAFVVSVPMLGVKALVLLIDPDESREPAEATLRQAFGLTQAEAGLAVRLARGEDLKHIARERDVSIGTVRDQLKALMAKTGTHRQSELVALLTKLALVPRSNGHG